MRKQIGPIAAVLLSTLIFLMGHGLLSTLTPVRAHLEGFSDLAIGLMGSAYYAGFTIGCFAGPRVLERSGHSRTFAMAAGLAAATAAMQPLIVDVMTWTILRAMIGFSAANLYMVIESWLNDRATNDTRGRIFAAYLTVNYTGLIIGQSQLIGGGARSFSLFNLAAVFYALCLIPVGWTRLPQPKPAPVPVLRPLRLFRIAPVGVLACAGVGITNGALWTLAPVYAQDHGMTRGLLAAFMVMFTLGGALSQLPAGRLSDHVDRRLVIAALSFLSAATGIGFARYGGSGVWTTLLFIALFGIVALPLYGLSVAHTNDRVPREEFVESTATLMLVNALGSVAGPLIAASVTARYGTASLFVFTAAIHLGIGVFAVARIREKHAPPVELHEPYAPMPSQASPAMLELDPRGPEHEDNAG